LRSEPLSASTVVASQSVEQRRERAVVRGGRGVDLSRGQRMWVHTGGWHVAAGTLKQRSEERARRAGAPCPEGAEKLGVTARRCGRRRRVVACVAGCEPATGRVAAIRLADMAATFAKLTVSLANLENSRPLAPAPL
jgi:hypothetical protein